MSQSESHLHDAWRPSAMVEVDSEVEAPSGFSSHLFRGMRFRIELLEPEESISTLEGWQKTTEELTEWGEVPRNIQSIELKASNRGPIMELNAEDGLWLAEIQPWGGPNLRSRSRIAPDDFDVPCGGYLHEDHELILLRRKREFSTNASDVLLDHLQRNDADSAQTLLHRCGAALGRYHLAAESEWTNPPDQKRWNERFHEIEARLKTASLWRAPFTRGAPATLDLGEVRLSQFFESNSGSMGIRVGPSPLAHGLLQTDLDLPAIRDLASLLQDISRIHYKTTSEIELSILRKSAIEGWSSTAPASWCSKRSFSAHTGGVVIWEYEQSLLDVVEAVSNQSGAPEPAVTLIDKVPKLQKQLFNARIFSASWIICSIFGMMGVFDWAKLWLNGSLLIPSVPLVLLVFAYVFRRQYHAAAPPPENPIH